MIITGRRKATRNHNLTDAEKEANRRLLNRERAAVEHGFANLKSWRILTKVSMNSRHAPVPDWPGDGTERAPRSP
ncbi:hypothetical protein GCM10010329_63130 [Streptomyces spiroverticillatus]|nr:hypothetical protein GCM10010329_63130 [Streptomyces spiroverticillatus]